MDTRSPRISTTVRNNLMRASIRVYFATARRIAPRAAVRRAAALFCTPHPGGNAPTPVAEGAQRFDIHACGHRLVGYQWGDPTTQPYVLFSHGWASSGARIAAWVPALRDAGLAVIAFDQIAHGASPGRRTTLPEFADVLVSVGKRFGPAHAVIGHSLGGAAAMLALSRGLQAGRAILVAPAADPVEAAHRFARAVGLGRALCERMMAGFHASLGITFDEQRAERAAPSIARPALIVHDVADPVVPWDEGERYARYWPRARLLSTQGLGHSRVLSDPGVINAGVRFLRGEAVGQRVVSTHELPMGVA
ncbi:alpha/beta fold hydrolase [Lysobacter sp. TY2-98]|nr:alpha/beta fold hydrolase [Lysobacter sp. TY2-98]